MVDELTLKDKAFAIWKLAKLPDFFNKRGPKNTVGSVVYLSHLEYTTHAGNWRETGKIMVSYNYKEHWTNWHKRIQKWHSWVWDALKKASVTYKQLYRDKQPEPIKDKVNTSEVAEDKVSTSEVAKDKVSTSEVVEYCDNVPYEELAAIDGTGFSRTNASHHYLERIDSPYKIKRNAQLMLMVDVKRRTLLSWRFRAIPRGETIDVKYLIRTSPVKPELVLMDKGFDSNPLHEWLRKNNIWSIAPPRKNCKKGRYRKQLKECFDYHLYWQRNIVESLIGAIKRKYGSTLKARKSRMQTAEINTKLIAYNIC